MFQYYLQQHLIFGLFRTFPIFPTQYYDLWVNLKFNGNNFLGSVASRRRFRGPGCHRSLKDLDVRDMTPKIGVEIRSKSTQLFAWRLEKLWGLHKMKFSLNILCWTEKKADNLRDIEMEWVLHFSWSKYCQLEAKACPQLAKWHPKGRPNGAKWRYPRGGS